MSVDPTPGVDPRVDPAAARPAARPIRVSIIEDECLMRSMLETTINAHGRMRVVHALPGASEARLVITPGSTDVAIVDVNLPDGNGVALGLILQRADPGLAVVLLSSQDNMGLFTSVAGDMTRPWSYLSKLSTFTADVLLHAVRAAARGEVVIDPFLTNRCTPRAESPVAGLTSTQLQVLRLVAEGLSNRAIADRLRISARSVESHLRTIYRRLDIDDEDRNRRVAAVLKFLHQTGRTWRR